MSVLDLFQLHGKTALVTGCRRGIGRAMAVALAEAGADIIGVSRHLESSGSEVEDGVRRAGRRFSAYQCDMAERQAVYAFIDHVQADHGTPDILVNNAGTIVRQPAATHADMFWDEVLRTDLDGPFVLAREFGKIMIGRGSGKIIFTASLLSFQGGINVPSYAAAKGAIAQLTRALANEWAKRGVQVNAIAPGYIVTDNTAELRANPTRSKAILSRIPAGRWGTPDDFKGAIVFLASAASDYVNGEILLVDGGWMGR